MPNGNITNLTDNNESNTIQSRNVEVYTGTTFFSKPVNTNFKWAFVTVT